MRLFNIAAVHYNISVLLNRIRFYFRANPIPIALHYLSSLSDDIRVIIANGPGFDDQNIAITVIDYIKKLGYTRTIEIIGKWGNRLRSSAHEVTTLIKC